MTAQAEAVDAKPSKPDVKSAPTEHEQSATTGSQALNDHALSEMNKRPGDSTVAGQGDHAHDAVQTQGQQIWASGDTRNVFAQQGKECGNEKLPACSLEDSAERAATKPGEDKGEHNHGHEFNIPGEDGKNNLHVDREGDQMTITRNGEKYELNKKEGTHEFSDNKIGSDGKPNSMEMGKDGLIHAHVDGEDYSISRDQIRQQFRADGDGNRFEMTHQQHAGADDPTHTQTDQLVSKPSTTDGDHKLALSDNTGDVRTTADQDGTRTFHVMDKTDASGRTDTQTVTYDTKDKTLKIYGQDDPNPTATLQAKDGQWINPTTGQAYTNEQLQNIQINGRSIQQGQDIQISGNGTNDGTTICLDGSVRAQVQGKQVTVDGAQLDANGQPQLDANGQPIKGVTATVDNGDGSSSKVIAQGTTTTTQDCNAQGACTVASVNGQGQLDAGQAATKPDGTIAQNPNGTPVMQSPDFSFNPGDGSQPATAQLLAAGQPEGTFTMAPTDGSSDGWQFGQANIGDLGITNGDWQNPDNQWQMAFGDGWSCTNDWGSWTDPSGQLAYSWDGSSDDYSSNNGDYFSSDTAATTWTAAAGAADTTESTAESDALTLTADAQGGDFPTGDADRAKSDAASLLALADALSWNPAYAGKVQELRAQAGRDQSAVETAFAKSDERKFALAAAWSGDNDQNIAHIAGDLDPATRAAIIGKADDTRGKKPEDQQLLTA
jgi:hypothetical protein